MTRLLWVTNKWIGACRQPHIFLWQMSARESRIPLTYWTFFSLFIVFTNAPCTQKENDSYTLQAVQFLPSTYRTMSLQSLQFEKLVGKNLYGCLLNFLFSYRQHSQIVYQKCVENIHKYVRHSHKSSVTSTYYFQIHLNISLG